MQNTDVITYLNDLIKNRRSVFPDQFVPGKKVDDNIVEQILTNATWAPNHGQAEPWLFTVFTDKGIQKFAELQSELYKATTPDNFKEATYLKLQTQPLKASHIIAIGVKKTPKPGIPLTEDIAAVACAVQNMYLSVAAYGLGGYWSTGGITYRLQAKAHFGLGEEDLLLGFFFIGHVAVPSPRGKRKPLDEKVVWVKE